MHSIILYTQLRYMFTMATDIRLKKYKKKKTTNNN